MVESGDIGKEMKKVEDDSGEKKRMWGVGGWVGGVKLNCGSGRGAW